MAINIAASQQLPDVVGNFQHGLQFGQQQRALAEQRADQAKVRALAPQIIAGDPGAYDRAAVIDPQAAGQYQQAGDSQMRRLKGAIGYIEQAQKSGNPQAVEAAYQQVRPYLARFGQVPPATFAEAEPKFNEAKARIAMLDAQAAMQDPTGFREFALKAKAAGLVPGTPAYEQAARVALGTEGRAATGGFGFELVTGPDGRQRYSRRNPRTGQVEIYDENSGDFVPLGGGAQLNGGAPSYAPQNRMPNDQIISTANSMIRAGIPPEQVEAWMKQQQSQPQFVGSPAPNPNLGVGQSPSEKNYQEELGQRQAQIDTARQLGQIEAETAAAKTNAQNAAERSQSGLAKAPQLQNVERGLDRIDSALSKLESGRFGDTGPIDQYYQRYTPEGQELEAAVGAIQNDMLALTRVPGIGSQSDLEAKIANMKYPQLSNDPSVNRRNLAQLRSFIKDLSESLGRAPHGTGPLPGAVQDGYRFRGGDPGDPNSWERL